VVERITNAETGGMKDRKDVQLHAIPRAALEELGRLYAYGAEKYSDEDAGDYNFQRGYAWNLGYDALMRHAIAWQSGETLDPETGLSHMAAVAWHALTLILFENEYPELDDRKTGFPAFQEEKIVQLIKDAQLEFKWKT